MPTRIATDLRDHTIDIPRMRRERWEKVQAAMEAHGLDALILCTRANARYVSDARRLYTTGFSGYGPAAVVVRGEDTPFVFGQDADTVPDTIPKDRRAPVSWNPPAQLARIKEVLGAAARGTIGVDGMSWTMVRLLPELMPEAKIVDANPAMWEARLVKTADEVACLRTVANLNESAFYRLLPAIRPGVRETELSGRYFEAIARLGHQFPYGEPVFCSLPKERTARAGESAALPYRQLPMDRALEEGDQVVIEGGMLFRGYLSNLVRTWPCSLSGRADRTYRRLAETWRAVADRVLEACRPGARGRDLLAALGDAARAPVPAVHGVGMGMEPPFLSAVTETDDADFVLRPGMVLSVAPYIWEEGAGGFRANETVLITEQGPELLTNLPHTPAGSPLPLGEG